MPLERGPRLILPLSLRVPSSSPAQTATTTLSFSLHSPQPRNTARRLERYTRLLYTSGYCSTTHQPSGELKQPAAPRLQLQRLISLFRLRLGASRLSSCALAFTAMAAPSTSYAEQSIHPTASSSASPLPPTLQAPRLDTPMDEDSDEDMSQSDDSAKDGQGEENEDDAEFEMDDQPASEPDSPPVRAPGFAAKQRRSKKLDLPEYLDADLYGLRRSVSCSLDSRWLGARPLRVPRCGRS